MDGKKRKAMLVHLYPNPRAAKALESALEGSRLLYNMLLEECTQIHEKGGPFPGKYGMYPLTTELRKNISDDLLAHMYSQVQQDVGFRIDFAFKRFFDRCRNGGVPGFPRFKGKAVSDHSPIIRVDSQ
jgi:putative transposase